MFQGVDPVAADQTAGLMRAYATTLEVQVREFAAALPECGWSGPDADRFREDWDGTFRASLGDAVEELRKHAKVLSDRAGVQKRLSQ